MLKFIAEFLSTFSFKKKIINQVIPLPPITSRGMNGEEWIGYLSERKYSINDWAIDCLGSWEFVTTRGEVYHPVIIRGDEFSDKVRTSSNVRRVVRELGFRTPPIELAVLVRNDISDEIMWSYNFDFLVVMHDPILDSDGDLCIMGSSCRDGGRGFICFDGKNSIFRKNVGFVFLAQHKKT